MLKVQVNQFLYAKIFFNSKNQSSQKISPILFINLFDLLNANTKCLPYIAKSIHHSNELGNEFPVEIDDVVGECKLAIQENGKW